MESSLSPTVNDQSFRDASLNIEIEQAHETWEQDVLESPASVMQCCKGLRICSTVSDSIGTVLCDHSAEHSAEWSAVMNENNPCVEMGTVTNYHSVMIGRSALQDIQLHVQWDCGLERQYSLLNGEWRNLKAIDPAPTGYKAPMIFCDVCYQPVMGFAFRCTSSECAPITGADVLYDLCYIHYNEGKHSKDHPFRCNIPTGDIRSGSQTQREILAPRSDSMCYQAIGLYPDAIVESHGTSGCSLIGLFPHPAPEPGNEANGKIIRIVHAKGQTEISKAEHWRCSAEVDPAPYQTDKKKRLQYWDVGTAGKVTLKATRPGVGGPVNVNHFPSLDIDLFKEMSKYKQNLIKMNNGASCWVRVKPPGVCWSVHITDTELTEIDDEEPIWSHCKNQLEVLNLIRNKLEKLPLSIKAHKDSLELLCLSFNCFPEIPSVVYKLRNLIHLNMHGNQISKLPADIAKLPRLTHLYLGRNKLQCLPDAFDSPSNLQEVSFEDNSLSSLPPSFRSLKNLLRLELGHNQFRKIPEVLIQLPKLKVLNLEHNRIQLVPPNVAMLLEQLQSLNLQGNPLQNLNLLSSNAESIIPLLKEILPQLESQPLQKHMKTQRVLVLGRCGAGKTSLVEALGCQKYVTPVEGIEHDHTVGINRYFVPVQMGEVVHELAIWDFAGEKTYGMINELFLAGNALNLVWLVVNLEQYTPRDPDSYHENVGRWLKGVLNHTLQPIVWVVCTHADKCSEEEVRGKCADIERLVQNDCDLFAEQVNESVKKYEQLEYSHDGTGIPSQALLSHRLEHFRKLQSAGPHFLYEHLEVLPLTNTYGFEGLKTLKEMLGKLSSKVTFCHLNPPLPDSWVAAADILTEHSKQKASVSEPPIIQRDEAHDLLKSTCQSWEVDQLLDYLHQSGEILPMSIVPNDQLKDKLVLNVDWLIDLLKQVFRHDFDESVQKKKQQLRRVITYSEITKSLADGICNAVIPMPLLKGLWALEGVDPEKEFPTVIRLMEELGLAYESPNPCGYLFPWLLTKQCPKEMVMQVAGNHITVMYDFQFFIPDGFFERFIVFCQQHLTINNIWCDALEGSHNSSVDLQVSCSSGGKIKLCCYSELVSPNYAYKQLWKTMMLLVKQMERLLSTYPGHRAQRFVLCPRCIERAEADPYLFHFEYLSPGPLSHHFVIRCIYCFIKKLKDIEVEQIVPPNEYMLKWKGEAELQRCTSTQLGKGSLQPCIQQPHPPGDQGALQDGWYQQSSVTRWNDAIAQPGRTRLQRPEPHGGLSPMQYSDYPNFQEKWVGMSSNPFPHTYQQTEQFYGNHVQIQYPCTGHWPAREQCHYFQPRPSPDGDIRQKPHNSPLCIPQAQFSSLETEPREPRFPVIRAALSNTRKLNNDDLKIFAENVKMVKSRWPMFARHLNIDECFINQVVQLDPCTAFEPPEICFQILRRWCCNAGKGATVAALARVVQQLGEESVWSEAFMMVLDIENEMMQ